jgi:NAD(P)-dependent dehydrogenase (short-subunit alcohol dehydrogenase family)
VNVNLNGAYYITTRCCLRCGSEVRTLIYISSVSGMVPDISGAAYQASSAA